MYRTAIRGIFTTAAVVAALAMGALSIVSLAAAPPAYAGYDDCDNPYSSDMPADPGTQPAPSECDAEKAPEVKEPAPATPTPTAQPTPTPPEKPKAPPTSKPKPSPRPDPTPTRTPPRPVPDREPEPTPPPVTDVEPPSTVTQVADPPREPKTDRPKKVKGPKKDKPKAKKTTQAACPAPAILEPVVTSDFQFPWLLTGIGALLAMVLGGIATARAYMATGHRWHPALRRIIAGPDHARIDS